MAANHSAMADFKISLIQHYWEYQKIKFDPWDKYLDQPQQGLSRPPVWKPDKASRNIFVNPQASEAQKSRLLSLIPKSARHVHFRSMNSSQAIAQSILGNLAVHRYLDLLGELRDENRQPIFEGTPLSSDNFSMEHKVNYLGEYHPPASILPPHL